MELLGCSGDDPLQSLNLSLSLQWIMLARHVLLSKAAVLHIIRVVEEEARLVVLERPSARVS